MNDKPKQVRTNKRGLKNRWSDVVIWKSFWEELDRLLLKTSSEAWFSGYRSGLREAKSKQKIRGADK